MDYCVWLTLQNIKSIEYCLLYIGFKLITQDNGKLLEKICLKFKQENNLKFKVLIIKQMAKGIIVNKLKINFFLQSQPKYFKIKKLTARQSNIPLLKAYRFNLKKGGRGEERKKYFTFGLVNLYPEAISYVDVTPLKIWKTLSKTYFSFNVQQNHIVVRSFSKDRHASSYFFIRLALLSLALSLFYCLIQAKLLQHLFLSEVRERYFNP